MTSLFSLDINNKTMSLSCNDQLCNYVNEYTNTPGK